MYYESRKNKSYGILLILLLLSIIIIILLGLIKKLENNFLVSPKNSEETGTDTVLTEFNLQDLAKNTSYSVVRSFKVKRKKYICFCGKF